MVAASKFFVEKLKELLNACSDDKFQEYMNDYAKLCYGGKFTTEEYKIIAKVAAFINPSEYLIWIANILKEDK